MRIYFLQQNGSKEDEVHLSPENVLVANRVIDLEKRVLGSTAQDRTVN